VYAKSAKIPETSINSMAPANNSLFHQSSFVANVHTRFRYRYVLAMARAICPKVATGEIRLSW